MLVVVVAARHGVVGGEKNTKPTAGLDAHHYSVFFFPFLLANALVAGVGEEDPGTIRFLKRKKSRRTLLH